ncbi:MAG: class B sortase [Lentihominibacter sp.]
MNPQKFFLKAGNALISFILILALVIAGVYSIYALWDNHRIYAAAENVQADLLQLKPDGSRASFEKLRKINPDVCAWITLDNTEIDYPVVQGKTNIEYLNTDVYGNFALAGSIFLDTRCDSTFHDRYSLIYGHHMDQSRMFGDLDLYKEKEFFDTNKTGKLIVPGGTYDLEIFACMTVASSDQMIFDPTSWQADIDGLVKYSRQKALHYYDSPYVEKRGTDALQVLALSTCSSESSEARTVILTVMKSFTPVEEEENQND